MLANVRENMAGGFVADALWESIQISKAGRNAERFAGVYCDAGQPYGFSTRFYVAASAVENTFGVDEEYFKRLVESKTVFTTDSLTKAGKYSYEGNILSIAGRMIALSACAGAPAPPQYLSRTRFRELFAK